MIVKNAILYMMNFRLLCCVLAITLRIKTMLGASVLMKTIVQYKDMSEYCKRRVVPSIFLGRQVAESSAEVLHFSRSDMPYSCSISVRTESGSNIILVIQLKSESNLIKSCRNNHDQLLVYEIGETFGGYWGALPESVLQHETPNQTTYYTLKSNPSTVQELDFVVGENMGISKSEDASPTLPSQDDTDKYVILEVPLVNVSGIIQLSETKMSSNDDDDLFDLIYDVTPRSGVPYETSVLPLVQFSVWKQEDQRRYGFEELEPRYQLDYSLQGFTPDYRLIYRTNNHRSNFTNRSYKPTKRLNFKKKNKQLFAVNNRSNHKYQGIYNTRLKYSSRPKNNFKTLTRFKTKLETIKFQEFSTHIKTDQLPTQITSYLELINVNNSIINFNDDINSENMSITKFRDNGNVEKNKYRGVTASPVPEKKEWITQEANYHKNYVTDGLIIASTETLSTHGHYHDQEENSANVNNNKVLNLNSDTPGVTTLPIREINKTILSITTDLKNVTQNITESTLKREGIFTCLTEILELFISVNSGEEARKELPLQITTAIKLKIDLKEPTKATSRKSEAGSLVDHESWENVVQVAPVIADLLNIPTPRVENNSTLISADTGYSKIHKQMKHKKRFIQALSIHENRPRKLITKEDKVTTPDLSVVHIDSQDLSEVVELEDDEIQGRVALRYFSSYVGPAIFNICDYSEAKARYIHLMNSSRIVIALENFTMDRMTIVLTETRVVGSKGCPPAHLECQVSGARVCVHHMNACDGIPNCGSPDIYDEDRLLCGVNVGFHYAVGLAACIFLLMLLTALYSLHYWLRRCVPKVSQAFFVYADKSENILYLDSVMRSPTDFDGDSRMVYHSSFFDSDDLSIDSKLEDNFITKLIKRCFNILFCKRKEQIINGQIHQLDFPEESFPKRKFSFTESELLKMVPITTINTSVQTGESLERAYLKRIKTKSDFLRHPVQVAKPESLIYKETPKEKEKKITSQLESENELKSLRALRDISASLQSSFESDSFKRFQSNYSKSYRVPVDEEVELQSHDYDPSGERVLSARDSIMRTRCEIHLEPSEITRGTKKHLRFEEGAIIIPPTSSDEEDKDNGQRMVVLGDDRLAGIDLDIIEEDVEQDSSSHRDFMRFWGGGKTKKSKKRAHLSLRQK